MLVEKNPRRSFCYASGFFLLAPCRTSVSRCLACEKSSAGTGKTILKSGKFSLLLLFFWTSALLSLPFAAPAAAKTAIPDDLFAWEKSRQVERLELSNYKDLVTKKAEAKEYRPQAYSYDDPNFRASGDLFSQWRFETLKGLARGTKPVLLWSEFEPSLEWTHKGSALQKTFVKMGVSFQRDHVAGIQTDKTEFYLDEAFLKMKFGKLDLKLGNLIESLGTGDEISTLDVINPRNYRIGLGSTVARAKVAVPAVRTDYWFSEKASLNAHLLPVHVKPKLAEPTGVWATYVQRLAAYADPVVVTYRAEEKDRDFENMQGHVAFAIDEDDFDLRVHAFRMFEPLPVVSRVMATDYTLEYPADNFFAVDGSLNVLDQLLLRGEFAYHPSRTFTSLHNGVVGESYSSDHMQALVGIDRQFPGELYFNLQGILSYINDFKTKTQMQQYGTEFVGTLRVSRGFLRDLLKLELQSLVNFTTEEFILKPSVEYRPTDALQFTVGVQKNDGGRNKTGPIDQYAERNHLFYESVWRF